MAITSVVAAIPGLAKLGNVVPKGYMYYEKRISPALDLALPQAYLKWYNIYPAGAEITAEQMADCRAFVQAEVQAGRLKLEDELGFIILHRAGPMLLLMVNTWRNTNEIWESVYARDVTQAASEWRPILFESEHRGTFCVWELGAVWHERHAWVRFLSSKRDEAAKLAYINDRFSGNI